MKHIRGSFRDRTNADKLAPGKANQISNIWKDSAIASHVKTFTFKNDKTVFRELEEEISMAIPDNFEEL